MQANSAAAGDDDDDDLAAIPPPGGLRVGSVCRLVKKSTSKVFNRAASAASDAEFVARFLDLDDHHLDDADGLSLPSSLPVFANARAGLWHVVLNSPRVQLCRFKSTDGHAAAAGGAGGSFPLSRLNLNVAAAAAAGGGERGGGGGAVIVDATRKGKRFPDALSRTIPIWAAVVNRACRLWAAGKDSSEEEEEGGGREAVGDLFRMMPPWVPASERAKVAERVESWARLLLSTGVDLSPFARELSERPLVPVWIARGGGGGGGGEAAGSPAVEVTRAQGDESAATSSTSATTTTTPLYLFSVSDPFARRATVSCGCGSSSGSSSSSIGSRSSTSSGETTNRHPSHGCFDHSFDYEPGGGDDEEGWGRGLSARLFWEHRGELLSRGPAGFEEAAEDLVRRRRRRREGGSGRDGEDDGRRGARAGSAGSEDASRRPPPASWSFVCGTRLAVGNAAAAAALCREQGLAPAVVILGSGDGGSGAPPSSSFSSSSNSSPLCLRAPVPPRKTKKLGLLEALPSVVAFASAHLARGRTVLLASGGDSAEDGDGDGENENENENGNESAAAAAAAVLLACFSPPPRAEFLRAFGGGGGGSGCGDSPPPSRPCGCPAPPRASREEVRARIAAVCGSAATATAAATGGGGDETSRLSSSPQPLLVLSVGKEAAKQLLMFVSPPERPGGFACPACRAGRPARIGWERAAAAAAAAAALGAEKGERQGKEVQEKTTGASGAEA